MYKYVTTQKVLLVLLHLILLLNISKNLANLQQINKGSHGKPSSKIIVKVSGQWISLLYQLLALKNTARTHQGIGCETLIRSEKSPETIVENTVLESKPILGGLYHRYKKVA